MPVEHGCACGPWEECSLYWPQKCIYFKCPKIAIRKGGDFLKLDPDEYSNAESLWGKINQRWESGLAGRAQCLKQMRIREGQIRVSTALPEVQDQGPPELETGGGGDTKRAGFFSQDWLRSRSQPERQTKLWSLSYARKWQRLDGEVENSYHVPGTMQGLGLRDVAEVP